MGFSLHVQYTLFDSRKCILVTKCVTSQPQHRFYNSSFLYANIRIFKTKYTFYLSVNVFSTKVLIGDTIFYFSNWRRDRHFTWSSEPREGLACCSAKGVPSFLGYFKTLSIGPVPGIEPANSRSAVNTLYRLS